eukprot:6553751-Prymnesium_polylepis.2
MPCCIRGGHVPPIRSTYATAHESNMNPDLCAAPLRVNSRPSTTFRGQGPSRPFCFVRFAFCMCAARVRCATEIVAVARVLALAARACVCRASVVWRRHLLSPSGARLCPRCPCACARP